MAKTRGSQKTGGRQKGVPNKKTSAQIAAVKATGLTPLEYMLTLMRRPYPKGADAVTKVQVDGLRFEAAKAIAPFIHPKPAARSQPIKLGEPEGSLADRGRKVLDAMTNAEISVEEAIAAMQVISAQSRIVESSELEARIAALEKAQHEKKH